MQTKWYNTQVMILDILYILLIIALIIFIISLIVITYFIVQALKSVRQVSNSISNFKFFAVVPALATALISRIFRRGR